MGCCNNRPLEIEIVTESVVEHTQMTPNLSFADISLQSKEEENNISIKQNVSFNFSQRARSTSCTNLFYNRIENAFLMTSPNKISSTVSSNNNFNPSAYSIELTQFSLKKDKIILPQN